MKRIVPHEPSWSHVFDAETAKLSDWLGRELVETHHIGSTAVRGLIAKPIVDILIEVRSVSHLDELSGTIANDGYDVRGEYGISGRRYFSQGPQGDRPGSHVHAYPVGHRDIMRHLAFRDYLKAKPDIAREYAALKRGFADGNGVLNSDYQEAKGPWVEEVEREAIEHFRRS